ncbi:MAG TPA: hypothetical protein PLJ21_02145 [Pseudobdellovibrionaceae bacterium]|nr:hypothetical protein [Pseudobdellovibrionaceae bacterium]
MKKSNVYVGKSLLKLWLFMGFLITTSPVVASSPGWPLEGVYGSNTTYCGMRIVRDARSMDEDDYRIISVAINNPLVRGHYCTDPGLIQTYRYEKGINAFRRENFVAGNYCLLAYYRSGDSFSQSCYSYETNDVLSTVIYRLSSW